MPARARARRSAQTALWHLARDLCRLAAPVLCFTSEEVWQELLALSGRPSWAEASVHVESFPSALDAPRDAALAARWERLMRVREEVNKALELARRDRVIGGSLEASVVLAASPDDLEFLRSFGDELRFLLITSGVELGAVGEDAFRSTEVPGLAVQVRPAAGAKCERCWHRLAEVGSDPEWPAICGRCVGAVRQILSEAGSA
jgi:isoleucyl-tRNA synthetase